MALTFITVNAHTNNVVNAVGHSVPFFPDPNLFTTFADDTDNGIKDLINNVNSHSFDSVMTGKQYINAYYDGTNVKGTLLNVPSSVPSAATISILGQSYQTQIVNNQILFPINIHPAVAITRITVSIKVDGFPFTTLEIAGSNGNIETQIYQDSNEIYHIVPLKSSELANYWQNNFVDMTWSQADFATIDGLLVHTLFHYVLPNMNLNLTVAEQNGLTDIQNTVLPVIPSTLANIIPDGVNADIHYNSYRYHMQQAKQAMDKYVEDRIEISKYTTLK